jgi:hypothetical protein
MKEQVMTRNTIVLLAAALAAAAPAAASAQEVRGRELNQQQRIGQGLSSGQITARGAANLENREAAINASRTADLTANGGRLTPGESRNLNLRENALSQQIYVDKHNGVAQPGVVPR